MAQPIRNFVVDSLRVRVYATQDLLVQDAAREVESYLRQVLMAQSRATAILATGNSQIQFLQQLAKMGGVDWSRITLFHMDEYLGLSADHPASFRHYMRERVAGLVQPKVFHYLEGDAWLPIKECERYAQLLRAQPIDLCCLGIGENGHLAFNDPHVADFDDPETVKPVEIDDTSRHQQVRDGAFRAFEDVPRLALTVTMSAIVRSRALSVVVPGAQKAEAVRCTLDGPIETSCPASALRRHPDAVLFVDEPAVSLVPA